MTTGLYERLVSKNYLIPHEEVSTDLAIDESAAIVIKPETVRHISYPYEWCFSQLKDAALLTLEITILALEYGLILKDASAYNVQFHNGKPIFIDTGSFEAYRKGSPWKAYHQFCKHFLAPLSLMAKKDIRLSALMRQNIDGIPLDLASCLLPYRSWMSFSLFAHIHAHALSQSSYGDVKKPVKIREISKVGLLGLLDGLKTAVKKLRWRPIKTEWGDYYDQTNYTEQAMAHKSELVRQYVEIAAPKTIWDLGGNTGFYGRIAMESGASVVCWDIDSVAVETNYRKTKQENLGSILPLIQDLTNPSPDIGWANRERDSLRRRSPVDMIMALALVHHLAISNNVPLIKIAEYFSCMSKHLLIEFVPKEDSQVRRLLANREDIFDDYNLKGFENAFSHHYKIIESEQIRETERHLFLMKTI